MDPSELGHRPADLPGLDGIPTALLGLTDLVLFAVDASGIVTGWSQGASTLLGHHGAEVAGRPASLLFADGWPAAGPTMEATEHRCRMVNRSGEAQPCAVRFLPAPSGSGFLILARDLRGELDSGRDLRRSRALRALLDRSTLVLDAGGRIVELDWTPPPSPDESWVGRHLAEFLEVDRREVLAALRLAARAGAASVPVARGGGSGTLTLRAIRDAAGTLEGFAGAPAAGPEGIPRDLFREAPLGMLLLDADLRIREINRELAGMCPTLLPRDTHGIDVRSLSLFQSRDIQAALDGLLAGYDFDLPEVRLAATGQGPGSLVRMQGRRLDAAGGARAGYFVALVPRDGNSDVERQLLRAQKMESIGNFASGLAHDFGNFVAVILGKAGVLRVKLPEDPHITRDLDDIETAAKRAQHLAQELMKFARGGRNRVARLDVNRLLEEVGTLIRTSVGKRISLDVRLEDGLPPIDGDEVELQQLVLNLCLNARDAMPNGGRLIVETRPLNEAQVLRLAGDGSVPSGVSIVVRDTGTGMPPEVLERIFEPFFTTKHDGNQGAGLGLAMVYGIVRRHGGAIDVKSRVGMGTAFEILLPAAGSTPSASAAQFTLVVDDEPAFGEMIRLILEEDGQQVKLASNGIEALRIIREELTSLAVVILDLRMPGVDGLAVLEELRELAPQLPVLVTTGYAGPEEKSQALARGARRVLEKPYRVAELRQALQEVLAGGVAQDG